MASDRITRREAIKSAALPAAAGAAIAAAAALPAVTHAAGLASEAETDPKVVHPVMCFHDKFRVQVDHEEYERLANELRAMLTREQWLAQKELVDLTTAAMCDEQDRFVDELCRHFPGLGPAIRAVAYHVIETPPAEQGTCCTEGVAQGPE